MGGLRDNHVFREWGGEAHLSGILQREFQKMVLDNQQLCMCGGGGGGVDGSVPPMPSRYALVLNEEIILTVVKQTFKCPN